MIKKTLTVTLQEIDLVTKESHDILDVKVGNNSNTIVLFPHIAGKMIVEKKDLAEAISEVEKFYGQTSTQTQVVEVAPAQKESEASEDLAEILVKNVNKELLEASTTTYIAVEYNND